jgi:hypothetical protein
MFSYTDWVDIVHRKTDCNRERNEERNERKERTKTSQKNETQAIPNMRIL